MEAKWLIQGHLAELSYGPKQSDLRLGFPDPWTNVCRRFWDCTKKKVICWEWRTNHFSFLHEHVTVCQRPGRNAPWNEECWRNGFASRWNNSTHMAAQSSVEPSEKWGCLLLIGGMWQMPPGTLGALDNTCTFPSLLLVTSHMQAKLLTFLSPLELWWVGKRKK